MQSNGPLRASTLDRLWVDSRQTLERLWLYSYYTRLWQTLDRLWQTLGRLWIDSSRLWVDSGILQGDSRETLATLLLYQTLGKLWHTLGRLQRDFGYTLIIPDSGRLQHTLGQTLAYSGILWVDSGETLERLWLYSNYTRLWQTLAILLLYQTLD